MPDSQRPRLTIEFGMVLIFAFALVFSLWAWLRPVVRWNDVKWQLGGAAVVVWPVVLYGVSLGFARASGGSQLRASVWLCAAYPWGALASLVGVLFVGSIRALDEGSPWKTFLDFVVWGMAFALAGSFVLGIAAIFQAMNRARPGHGGLVTALLLIPIASWVGAFAGIMVVAMGLPRD